MSTLTELDRELRWIVQRMPLTAAAVEALPDLTGVRLACSMHLEEKMAPAIGGLLARGAKVFLTTCNPATVRDELVAWCVARGAEASAWKGMSSHELATAVEHALDFLPTHLCEMGADITAAIVHREQPTTVRGALEATGSGIARLAGMKPPYPIYNWDDLPIKEGLHNRHMVGLVACHAFFDKTRLTFHGMRVLVVGYGLVGRGVCDAVRAFGGQVMVAERDAGRALEARFAGWAVRDLRAALPEADVVITATGARDVIGVAEFPLLRDGAFLVNVGHASAEIDLPALRCFAHEPLRPFVEEFRLDSKRRVLLFAGGSMANLSAGQGDSLNAFDVTLATMVAGIGFLVGDGERQQAGVHILPRAAWIPVAQRAR